MQKMSFAHTNLLLVKKVFLSLSSDWFIIIQNCFQNYNLINLTYQHIFYKIAKYIYIKRRKI